MIDIKKIIKYQLTGGKVCKIQDYYIIGDTSTKYVCVSESDAIVGIMKSIVYKGSPKDFKYQGQPFVYFLVEDDTKNELESKINNVIALIEYYRLKSKSYGETIKEFEGRLKREKAELSEMNKHIQQAIQSLTDSLKILKERGE